MAITTILSDLGNVVVFFDNDKTARELAALAHNTPEAVKRIFFDRFAMWNLFDRGFIRREDMANTILGAIGYARRRGLPCDHALDDVRRAWKDVFTFNEPVLQLWKQFKEDGLKITAVSNVDALRWEEVYEMVGYDLFHATVLSFEEECIKQEGPRMFERALERSGCEPHEALFIDDREDCLEWADRLGIHTHLYDHHNHKALERKLMLLGVRMLPKQPQQG